MKTIAIIIAAGKSKRMQNHYSVPKQYLPLGKSTILRESILKFKNHPDVSDVLCVIRKEDLPLYEESTVDLDILNPVIGGDNRLESIYEGLKALEEFAPTNIIIHYANRPFVDKEIITGVIKHLDYCDAVVSAIKEEETIKVSKSGNIIESSFNEKTIWKLQTPEGYKYTILYNLFKEEGSEFFNDIPTMFENAGLPVSIIPGSKKNFEIINQDDYEKAQAIYSLSLEETKSVEIRVGNSFNYYNLTKTTKDKGGFWLFGVKIPLNMKIEAENPKDIGLDTIGDAIIGAIGLGCAYCCPHNKNKRQTKENLRFVSKLLNKRSAKINNIDITCNCNILNICKYKKAMAEEIASQLNIPRERINIKNSGSSFTNLLNDNKKLVIFVITCIKIN